jgi:MtrB/PioB family decaheme-associated outer membrane protein
MKRQVGLVRTSLIGVLLSSAAWVLPGALAQAAEPVPYWWFHGTVEAGGRFFLNNPQRNGSAYLGEKSLAKYYEYSDIKPGPFGNVWMATGSNDGLYQVDLGGKNIGYDDQSYYLDLSQAGKQYLSLGWDQTPHVYSTSAQTFYQGVGTTSLTLPPGFLPTSGGAIANYIAPYLYTTDIGIKRDTGSVEYRWTPDDAWDIKADYSHMHRHGTQVDGVTGFGPSYPEGPTQVPRPVDDTTQNYGLNGEYAGISPWGKRFTFKLAYKGSSYDDAFTSYTIEDPITGGTSQPARLSTWPSNRADAFSGTLGADLPWNSRYAGTISYDMMRQNDSFIPMSTGLAYTLPQSSLDGRINTLLSNNILTTRLTPELTSKLSYRYYDFKNDTPELYFPNYIHYDSSVASTENYTSLSMAYTKQNAGAALNWRPSRHWNIGAAYGWEHYSWTRADVNATNENSGKVHADWMPTSWFTLRSSAYYASRRYDNYDYYGYVCDFNFNGSCLADNEGYSAAYRQLMIDNRDRWKANIGVDVVVAPGVTVTPSFKYQDDNYGLDPKTEEGLRDSRLWSGGIDVTYLVNPGTSITFGYLREYATQLVYNCSCGGHNHNNDLPINNPSKFMQTNDRITVDTFTALARYAAIPDVLDLSLRYTLSRGKDHQDLLLITNTTPIGFPDDTTWFQRLDATAVYTFDKDTIARLGWKGKVKAKLHYAWERNSVANWQNDTLAPYNPTMTGGTNNFIFMAYDNPNYNVHMLMASLAVSW